MNIDVARNRMHDIAAMIESRFITPATAASMVREVADELVPQQAASEIGAVHYHVAKYDAGGKLGDACRDCGKDLRDAIHKRG